MPESIVALLVRMPRSGPGYSEAVEALEAYTVADKARDKAHDAWRIAEQRLLARQEALERIINHAARTSEPYAERL
jgi:hypothetical protein